MKKILLLIYILAIGIQAYGQDYAEVSSQGQVESFQGVVGIYSEEVKNQKLANGDFYNPNLLTAAHADLPFGTQVRITNYANGKSMIATINDRILQDKGRVLDVSLKVAQELDFVKEGVAYANIEVLSDLTGHLPKEQPAIENYMDNNTMSIKTDDTEDKVEKDTMAVKKINPTDTKVKPELEKETMNVNRIFIIQFGAFSTEEKAKNYQKQLKARGIDTYYAKEGIATVELYKVRENTIYRDLQEVFAKVLDYKEQGLDCFAVGKFFVDDKKTNP